jgi:polyphosphate glucokinase
MDRLSGMAQEGSRPVIGVDIGGTTIKSGLVDVASGRLLGSQSIAPTPQFAPPEQLAVEVAAIVDELVVTHAAVDIAETVGITFPGIVHRGVARSAANLDSAWVELEVDKLFTDLLGRPSFVTNDADAAGLAEVRYGVGNGVGGLVIVITLGTGIGSALIVNGELVPNSELGHLELDGHEAETKASARAREREGLDWETYAGRLQRYFSHLEFLFSPDLFVVGGGISHVSGDILPLLNLRTRIVPAELRNSAGTIGAALYAASRVPAMDGPAAHGATATLPKRDMRELPVNA